MKNIVSILFMAIILFSCSSTKKNTKTNSSSEQITSSSSTNDGSSYENAIFINESSETTGVAKEYEWLRKNYPGYQSLGQSLNYKNGKPYDIIKIKTAEGVEKSFYFDISKFFGKF